MADVVFARPPAAAIGPALEQLPHRLAVLGQHATIVGLGRRRGASHQTRVKASLTRVAPHRDPLSGRRQPGRVETDELLAQMQPGRFLKGEQGLDAGCGDGG